MRESTNYCLEDLKEVVVTLSDGKDCTFGPVKYLNIAGDYLYIYVHDYFQVYRIDKISGFSFHAKDQEWMLKDFFLPMRLKS